MKKANRYNNLVNSNAEKAYNQYVKRVEKVNPEYRQRKLYTFDNFKDAIASEHAAGSSWKEAVKNTVDSAYLRTFNDYSEYKNYKVHVLSEKQALQWQERLYSWTGQKYTLDDLMFGKVDLSAWVEKAKLEMGSDAAEFFMLFWKSD